MSNLGGTNGRLAANGRPAGGNNIIVSVIVIILVLVGLYYLYKFLYGTPSSQASVSILSSPTSATATTLIGGTDVVASSSLTGIVDGGAYTTSMWVYINNTVGLNTQLAHLFDISNKGSAAVAGTGAAAAAAGSVTPAGNTLIFVGLNPRNGALIVRQSTADQTSVIDNSMTSSDTGITNTKYPLSALINNYNVTGDTYKKDDRCDIVNGIEYQRWVLITIVANGRTLDVYIDGKLARSCVYKSNYAMNSTTGKATAYVGSGNGGGLKGFFSNVSYANYAFTPDAIWAQYQAGPGTPFSLSNFFGNLFSTSISFGTTGALATK
jgi:hypothetical protein